MTRRVGTAAQRDEKDRWIPDRHDQLAEAPRRRFKRIEPFGIQWNRLGRLNKGVPVVP